MESTADKAIRIAGWISRERQGLLDESGLQELHRWLDEDPANQALYDNLRNEDYLQGTLKQLLQMDPEPLIQRVLYKTGNTEPGKPGTYSRVHFLKTAWFRYAAVLLLISGAALYLYRVTTRQQEIVTTIKEKPTDILPGGNKATLTLADGSTILLDSAANGSLARQGNTRILKPDAGSLAYQAGASSGQIFYNTISTPIGGQYQVTLPDGTKVWLNAASSIRFPAVFTQDRTVIITGEAYLEVATDKTIPFYVKAAGVEVQVLGTSLNINAYSDENETRTTLIEGSIKVIQGSVSKLLKPGQQALTMSASSATIQVQMTDIAPVIAWKEGYFNFNRSDLKSVMRQIARWYDLEIIYESEPKLRVISGEMGRTLNVSQLMDVLKNLNINCRIEGRKLIVME